MKPTRTFWLYSSALLLLTGAVNAQVISLAPVVEKPLSKTVPLPGEFLPFLTVEIHAKVAGYVENVLVDRGSIVKKGDLLVKLSAPEMEAQIAEAESKKQSAEADRLQAQAQLVAEQGTYDRMKKAAETPGAVAGNELLLAKQRVAAVQATVRSREQAAQAADAAIHSFQATRAYLQITAPFSGVITDRQVHPGALVGPSNDVTLVVLQQVSRLRLVVPVPEEYVGAILNRATVPFHVPAFPAKTYSGTVARLAHSMDQKTRTMAVEMDVSNTDRTLAPGMYPIVQWPVRGSSGQLFVPKTSVVTTTERTFVIRDASGKAQWVDVKKGSADGDAIQVLGNLKAGDKVVRRASDEIREGAALPKKEDAH